MIPGLGRSPGEGKGDPFQYSGLENSMDHSPCCLKELDMTEQLSLSLWQQRGIKNELHYQNIRKWKSHGFLLLLLAPSKCFFFVFFGVYLVDTLVILFSLKVKDSSCIVYSYKNIFNKNNK